MIPSCDAHFLRVIQNRRLEATVVGMVGWAFIRVGEFEPALAAFRRMAKVSALPYSDDRCA